MLALVSERKIASIEIIANFHSTLRLTSLRELMGRHLRLHSFIVHSCSENHMEAGDNILFITEKITSEKHCGIVSPEYFSTNIKTFTEAKVANSCLNRKMGIDAEGNIKNCPTMQKSYGNINNEKTSLLDIARNPHFQDVWNVTKDQVEVCKDCEFRYICTDCRAQVANPSNPLSKPKGCSYDPYTGVWK